jgi:hypothetical protein
MSSGDSVKSTPPAATALRGMLLFCADLGSCANAIPPAALMACSPRVPSVPMPERITPMARLPCSSAKVRKKESIGM